MQIYWDIKRIYVYSYMAKNDIITVIKFIKLEKKLYDERTFIS